MTHANRYDLPKGHIEPGESDEACAYRELQEETGLTNESIRKDPDFRFEVSYQANYKRFGGETVRKTVVLFAGFADRSARIVPTEHADFEWRTLESASKLSSSTIRKVARNLLKHLRKT